MSASIPRLSRCPVSSTHQRSLSAKARNGAVTKRRAVNPAQVTDTIAVLVKVTTAVLDTEQPVVPRQTVAHRWGTAAVAIAAAAIAAAEGTEAEVVAETNVGTTRQ